jgi:hypothetical protein
MEEVTQLREVEKSLKQEINTLSSSKSRLEQELKTKTDMVSILYSLFSILYSLFSILYSLFSILYSLFSILYSLSPNNFEMNVIIHEWIMLDSFIFFYTAVNEQNK